MELLLISVLCSVLVSVILKTAPAYQLDIRQIIGAGYLVSAALCYYFLQPNLHAIQQFNTQSWAIFLIMGALLPSLFLILAKSITHSGIVLTDAAQRLSLLLPLLAAFLFFNETFSWLKGLGLLLGFAAMLFLVINPKKSATKISHWPLLVFFGMAVVDILFKLIATLSHTPFNDILFAIFSLSFLLSALYLTLLWLRKRLHFSLRNLLMAVLLGALNFGNILFYIKAHQHFSDNPALVFASMNIGVIALGTITGLIIFKEQLNKWNAVGIALAVIAVSVLAATRF